MENINENERITQEQATQGKITTISDVILLSSYVDREHISHSYRETEEISPDGSSIKKITKYVRRFHCGHHCQSSKDLGMDCENKIPHQRKKNWSEPYHIVCKECVIPQGCAGCGKPGDRLCLVLQNGHWYCAECLGEIF